MPTIEEATNLIIQRIPGFRIGTVNLSNPIPNYEHSIGVYAALKKHGFAEDTQMAGLLHDIIEDSGTEQNKNKDRITFDELRKLGYTESVLHLVDLSTHDVTMEGNFEKWEKMLARLIQEDNREARAIKLADISNNLLSCHLMPNKERLDRFLNKKCPVFIYYGNKYFGGTEFYNEFLNNYFHQVKAYNKYFI